MTDTAMSAATSSVWRNSNYMFLVGMIWALSFFLLHISLETPTVPLPHHSLPSAGKRLETGCLSPYFLEIFGLSAIHTIPKPINSPSMGVGPRCTEGGIYKLLSAVYSSLLNHSTSGFIHQNTSAEVTWSLSLRCVLQSTMARVDVPSLLLPDWITDSVY
jgi:hypothetical protein